MTPRTLPPLAHLGRAVGILAGLWLLTVPAVLRALAETLEPEGTPDDAPTVRL